MDKLTNKPYLEKDKITKNSRYVGRRLVIDCIKCSAGELIEETRPITYTIGAYTDVKTSELRTYYCTDCGYYYINQEHVNLLKINAK